MILKMYSIRDKGTGFRVPSPFDNDYVAIRSFNAVLHDSSIMSENPSDFALYNVGEYDTDTGIFTGLDEPCLVCTP